jgi:dipeptidase E
MKLLLTSSGITNRSIADALTELVGKSPFDTKVGLIPTARNAEPMRRGGYIGQFLDLWKNGFSLVDVIDPSAADIAWKERLADVDVIYVAGGNTFHLLNQARLSGFDKWLHENKDKKVYLGVSAGTILATPTIEVAAMPPGDENLPELKDLSALSWVQFEIEPHCDMNRFKTIEKYASENNYPVYAIDDLSAIKVDGSNIEVISEGSWKKFG